MARATGSRLWVFPDGELPKPGPYEAKGHESVIIVNTSSEKAVLELTIYYTDKDPVPSIKVEVDPERVRCIRMNNPDDLEGYIVPVGVQYAMKWESTVPVVMMYGRLDTTDQPMHFYINQAYSE